MTVGETNVMVTGVLTWVPGPPRWPWLLAALALLVSLGLGLRVRRWWLVALGALVVAIALDLAVAGGYFAAAGETGTDRSMILVFPLLGLLALWRYVVQLHGGVDHPPPSLLIAGLLLLFMSGVDRLTVLDKSQLLFSMPPALARISATVSLGVEAALAVTFVAQLRTTPQTPLIDEGGEPDD